MSEFLAFCELALLADKGLEVQSLSLECLLASFTLHDTSHMVGLLVSTLAHKEGTVVQNHFFAVPALWGRDLFR
jgi:hypothetical protein